MDSQISKSAEVPVQVEFRESTPISIHAEASSNGLSESHRQSHSKLRPHQISHPGITPHSRSPCSEAEEVNAVEMDQRSTVVYELRNPAPSSTTLLYHTLVQDGAVPPGFQQEFEGLAPAIEGGTAREARKAAATSDFDAAHFLHERSEELRHKTRAEKTWQTSWFREQQSENASTAPGT